MDLSSSNKESLFRLRPARVPVKCRVGYQIVRSIVHCKGQAGIKAQEPHQSSVKAGNSVYSMDPRCGLETLPSSSRRVTEEYCNASGNCPATVGFPFVVVGTAVDRTSESGTSCETDTAANSGSGTTTGASG